MFKGSVIGVALVLGTSALAAQTAKPGAPQPAPDRYVPAIMQARMTRVLGCLQQKQDVFVLADVKVAQQGAPQGAATTARTAAVAAPAPSPMYQLEGLSAARLDLYVGKRVEVVGGFQGGAPSGGDLPRFEATDLTEQEGSCS